MHSTVAALKIVNSGCHPLGEVQILLYVVEDRSRFGFHKPFPCHPALPTGDAIPLISTGWCTAPEIFCEGLL